MKRVLIVCTGNICRSPMAAGFLKKGLAERGMDDVEVESTGTYALEGSPAEPMAQEVVKPFGVDISEHRARMISREMIESADRILVMAPEHKAVVGAIAPRAAERIRLLAAYGPGGDPERAIPDPYGGSAFHYRACAVEIMEAIEGFLNSEGRELEG